MELLVVIGIIALLASILLVALKGVNRRAKQIDTIKTMEAFSNACDVFYQEFNVYPGVIPENVLAQFPQISGMENALLHLLGGYRVLAPTDTGATNPVVVDYNNYRQQALDNNPSTAVEFTFGVAPSQWQLVVDLRRIGEGPVIGGKPYAPFYTPTKREFGVASYSPNTNTLPDLLDSWGQPIMYLRRIRSIGPLVGGPANSQFARGALTPYLSSTALGESGNNQVWNQTSNPRGSVLSTTNTLADPDHVLAQVIRTPAFGPREILPAPLTAGEYVPQGQFILFSAGPDGVFFAATDGPGTPTQPQLNIATGQYGNPQVVRDYDDVIKAGGG